MYRMIICLKVEPLLPKLIENVILNMRGDRRRMNDDIQIGTDRPKLSDGPLEGQHLSELYLVG